MVGTYRPFGTAVQMGVRLGVAVLAMSPAQAKFPLVHTASAIEVIETNAVGRRMRGERWWWTVKGREESGHDTQPVGGR